MFSLRDQHSLDTKNWQVLSDEQMSKEWPFSLLNDEQMSNWLGVEHCPVVSGRVCPKNKMMEFFSAF